MINDLDPATKRWLVGQAEKILDDAKEKDRSPKKDVLKNQASQLRNMLQIAQRESEITVLRNFIHYQAGRKATQKFWGAIQVEVIDVLEEIGKRYGGEDEASTRQRRTAIQHFFGYLVRHYFYVEFSEEKKTSGNNPPKNRVEGPRP